MELTLSNAMPLLAHMMYEKATYTKAQNVAAENQAMACDAMVVPYLLADATLWQNP